MDTLVQKDDKGETAKALPVQLCILAAVDVDKASGCFVCGLDLLDQFTIQIHLSRPPQSDWANSAGQRADPVRVWSSMLEKIHPGVISSLPPTNRPLFSRFTLLREKRTRVGCSSCPFVFVSHWIPNKLLINHTLIKARCLQVLSATLSFLSKMIWQIHSALKKTTYLIGLMLLFELTFTPFLFLFLFQPTCLFLLVCLFSFFVCLFLFFLDTSFNVCPEKIKILYIHIKTFKYSY